MTRAESRPPKADDAVATGSGGEQLSSLKHSNVSTYKQWQTQEERKREKERALAEAYRDYKEKQAEEAREGRRRRLAELQHSSVSSSREESYQDGEYAVLMQKYGHRIRVQVPPLPSLESSSILSSCESTSTLVPKRPPVPRTERATQPKLEELRKSVLVARRQAEEDKEDGQSPSHASRAPRMSLAPGALAAVPTDKAPTLPPVQKKCFQSAMPKKERLRQKQQSLLKATGVVFYKSQMKAHMQRILTAVELTFDKNGPQVWKDRTRNLARPRASENRRMTAITPTDC
eukprot:gb/GFBE01032425.1/.p1 GENE.gb/GFBE01032425.1/~~gb/GFBE01032425.1/.p1  ORF type:complete len:289 (+),score=37.60 gb/GFBE01032425.1/:1-867(+)